LTLFAKYKHPRLGSPAQVDLTTGMSVEASRQIEELKRRIHVLEKQNAVLNTKARTLQDHSTSTSIDLGGSPLFPKKIL